MPSRTSAAEKRGVTNVTLYFSCQRLQQNIALGCEGHDPYHTSCLGRLNHNIHVRRWQSTLCTLSPLDDAHAFTVKVVAHAEEFQLAGVFQTVEIEVIKVEIAECVRLDEGKRRTLHCPRMAQAVQYPAHQRGLAGAQRTVDVNETKISHMSGEFCPQCLHVRHRLHRSLNGWHVPPGD